MMLKIAHRGASGYAPENTFESFQKAIDLKADMIELDIHQHHGQLIVCHNPPHPALSPKGGEGKGEGEQTVLLLQDVIRFAEGKIQLNIEIKKGGKTYPGIEKNLITLLKQEGFENQCFVSSFDAPTMAKVKQLQPSLTCGLIFDRRPMVYLQQIVEMGLDIVHPRWTVCTPQLVEKAHQKKKKVLTWTVNTPGQAEYFKRLGVDGIMSDYPDIL